jgi:MltA-interacting protein MipA
MDVFRRTAGDARDHGRDVALFRHKCRPVGGIGRYFWTPQFATHAFLEYERLTGDAAGSPLVEQRGTPNQLTIGFGATHSFDIKSPW